MPEALRSFLFSVAMIIAVALIVPCIESIVKLLRRNTELQKQPIPVEVKRRKSYSREVA